MLSELGRAVPEIKLPLIDERDQYLASRMLEAGRGRRSAVVVVGAAHVPGIQAAIGQPIDRAALERIPPPSRLWRAIQWLVPIAFAAALIHVGGDGGAARVTALLRAWILPISIGAGITTAIAGGTPASLITALGVAPITALVPRLTTGMVVGSVEAWLRRPSEADRDRLGDDLGSIAGFRKNPVSRILLVAIASGIGTTIGFWIAVIWILRLL
jgi:pheromone shutdown protein TraB